MKSSSTQTIALMLAILCAAWVPARAEDPEVAGHLCLVGPQASAYIAVEVHPGFGMTLSEVRWQFGPGTDVTEIAICPDSAGKPDLEQATVIGEDLHVTNDGWIAFDAGESSSQGNTLWIVANLEPISTGETPSEGAGIGYYHEAPLASVLCGDGTGTWGRLTSLRPAVEFSAVAAAKMSFTAETDAEAGMTERLLTEFLGVAPNPSPAGTTFHFSLRDGGPVHIDIFDVRGRRVTTLGPAAYRPGTHSTYWNGRDHAGTSVASGVYFATVQAPGLSVRTRILLVR